MWSSGSWRITGEQALLRWNKRRSAPLWAGFMGASANSKSRGAKTQSSIGFVNPTLSAIGQGSDYALAFHDALPATTQMTAVLKSFLPFRVTTFAPGGARRRRCLD